MNVFLHAYFFFLTACHLAMPGFNLRPHALFVVSEKLTSLLETVHDPASSPHFSTENRKRFNAAALPQHAPETFFFSFLLDVVHVLLFDAT